MDEVHVQGRSKKQSIVLDRNFVIERMNIEGREYTQKQVEGCFSQPNGVMCEQMVSWAVRVRIQHAMYVDVSILQSRSRNVQLNCSRGIQAAKGRHVQAVLSLGPQL